MRIDVDAMFDDLEAEYRRTPTSMSGKLWALRQETNISSHNPSPEVILERSVVMMARRGRMTGYYNQCPAASGIFGPYKDRRSAVDLVHWSGAAASARLIELKWMSGEPGGALAQILRYGVLYVLCRAHRKELPLDRRPLMDARRIALEVVAPQAYYAGSNLGAFVAYANSGLRALARAKIGETFSMSLGAYAFPRKFDRIPFATGGQAAAMCDTAELTDGARRVRDAFGALSPIWPSR